MNSKARAVILRLLALAIVIAISVTIFLFRDKAEQLARFGYPGVFLLAFISYATVLLPAPGIAVVFSMGGVLNPIFVALAAGAGAALGELTGYLAGYSSQILTEKVEVYQRLVQWMGKNGPITVLVLSAIPNPFFDLAGAAAGSLKMPYPKFLLWCWLGQTLKMLFFALLGKGLFDLIP
jgi:membrane protein DedA with SNARE-associated domain